MVRKEEQSENAALSIDVKLAGKVMSESAWQLAKAEAPMLVTMVGRATDLSEVQPVKAFAGMHLTLGEMWTLVTALPAKTSVPKRVWPVVSVTVDRAQQPAKAELSTWRTLSGNVTDVSARQP